MFALFLNSVVLLAGGGTGFYDKYLNYPGFEAWKFVNLAIFVGILIYLAKKPIGEAFKAKRDAIRAELIRAEEEKQAALKSLTSAEAKLATLENEKAEILIKAAEEAEAEKRRLSEQADLDIKKLREQTGGEVSRLQKQTMVILRRFSAEESVRLAEEKLKAQIDTQKDQQLVKSGISSIGGLN